MFNAFILRAGVLGGAIATLISHTPTAPVPTTTLTIEQQAETLVSRQHRPRQSRGTGRREIMTQPPQPAAPFTPMIG